MNAGWANCLFANSGDYAAIASFTSEKSLLAAGIPDQPTLPPYYFQSNQGVGKTISILARGVFSTTGTPTYKFQARLGTTLGPAYVSGTSVGVSAAITTASSVTNVFWELRLDLTCYTPGLGSNCILSGAGSVWSPTGFAAPLFYPLEPTTPDTATWTATIDASLAQYLNLSVTCGSSSSSNTLTLKTLLLLGLN